MYRIGVDLGGTNIAVGIVDESYKILVKGSVPTMAQRAPELIVDDMAALCRKLVKDAKLTLKDIISVGIAAP
ncbi:MAG: ROK family protein, partial [Clostridia bacterium]|nr:ROK family protein [Clostridia bacterium]